MTVMNLVTKSTIFVSMEHTQSVETQCPFQDRGPRQDSVRQKEN
jgi:hypothetical protein